MDGGLDIERQVRYCGKMPPFWRNFYVILIGGIVIISALVSPAPYVPNTMAFRDCIRA